MAGVNIFRDAFPILPLMAKLSPAEFGLSGLMIMAELALENGATGITAINTMIGLAINSTTGEPVLTRKTGGYSGPGILPIALASVWRLRQRFAHIPIAGCGGVRTLKDVDDMHAAGATLIQVGCATFTNPTLFQSLSQA
jgi:dihydroorotate dehydrogenase (NAD+) catalytic subunit